MIQERRYYARYPVQEHVKSSVQFEDGDPQLVDVKDISCGGARIACFTTDQATGKISFTKDSEADFSFLRNFSVKNATTGDRDLRISFDEPLKGAQLGQLAGHSTEQSELDLAKSDTREVYEQIRGIQECRSRIFLGTLTLISVWVMGGITLSITEDLRFSLSVFFGALLPFAILTTAIFASIEKATAINDRKGFIAALSKFTRHNLAPPNYRGWATLHANSSECRARKASGCCPKQGRRCGKEEWRTKVSVVSRKHLFPKVLGSFTAFSSVVYGLLYIIASVILIYSSLACVSEIKNDNTWLPRTAALGAGIVSSLVLVLLLYLLHNLRKGKNSLEARYVFWLFALENCRNVEGEDETKDPE